MQKRGMTSFLGRSMVEMLGVLAIIGVLSVGVLAGYSKAMKQHRLNRQTEQVNTIVSAVVRHWNDLKDIPVNSSSTSWVSLLKAMGEIPQDMYFKAVSYREVLQDTLKTRYRIYHHDTGYVAITAEIDNSDVSVESCRNIYKTLIPWSPELLRVQILRDYSGSPSLYTSTWHGDKACSLFPDNCLKNLTISDLEDLCNVCEETRLCRIFIRFK